jgi:hypothetical protein
MAAMVGEGPDTSKTPLAEADALRAERKRRLVADDILVAFRVACDIGDSEVATRLLGVIENILIKRMGSPLTAREQDLASLTDAFERLRTIRPQEPGRSR